MQSLSKLHQPVRPGIPVVNLSHNAWQKTLCTCSFSKGNLCGNENAAAGDLAKEHTEHLRACGVTMGRGGFAVKDLHNQNDLLELPVGEPAHRNDHQQILSEAERQNRSLCAC